MQVVLGYLQPFSPRWGSSQRSTRPPSCNLGVLLLREGRGGEEGKTEEGKEGIKWERARRGRETCPRIETSGYATVKIV